MTVFNVSDSGAVWNPLIFIYIYAFGIYSLPLLVGTGKQISV